MKKGMPLINTTCPICDHVDQYDVIFKQNFSVSDINIDVFSARRLPDRLHAQIVKCRLDGLYRSQPTIPLTVLAKLYQASKFTYEAEVANLTKTYLQSMREVLQILPPEARILEIGCGNGFILASLMKMGFKHVYGLEPSSEAISQAEPFIKKRIKQSIFKKDLFAPQSFDFIFMFQTLDHIPRPDQFLRDSKNLLKKSGYFLSFHHNVESWSAKILGEKSPIFDVEHAQLFSHHTSKLLLEKVGLEVISVFSPISYVSLKHLLWLFPLPPQIKGRLLANNFLISRMESLTLPVSLGNTVIVGRKRW